MRTVTKSKSERIAKFIAGSGLCSRREAERLIAFGKVSVNGVRIDSPALNVTADDIIEVNNKLIKPADKTRLWLFHKPSGYVVSRKDEKGRETIYNLLPADMQNAIYVGRLDLTSEGLLLLTNNGDLSRHLELPSTGWIRKYRARIFGNLTDEDIEKLQKGITVDGMKYAPITVVKESSTKSNSWVELSLREGKNREIRRIMEHLGYPVSRLIRISYGSFNLGNLKEGELKEVTQKVLANALGKFLDEN